MRCGLVDYDKHELRVVVAEQHQHAAVEGHRQVVPAFGDLTVERPRVGALDTGLQVGDDGSGRTPFGKLQPVHPRLQVDAVFLIEDERRHLGLSVREDGTREVRCGDRTSHRPQRGDVGGEYRVTLGGVGLISCRLRILRAP
jgi:hypothetical protein